MMLSCKDSDVSDPFFIKKGEFSSVITETGELQAVNARVLFMPYIGWQYGGQFKITGLVNHGTLVKEGDSIAQFDFSSVKKSLLGEQIKLEVEKTKLNKLVIEQLSTLNTIESQIESLEAAFNLKKLQVEKFKFESEKKKKVKQKELDKAKILLEKTKNNYVTTKFIIENDLKIQKIKIKKIENNVSNARTAISKLTIRSPISGMMQVMENRRTNNMFQLGDEVQQGGPFTLIPDISKMRVKSTINEVDYGKVFLGQKVVVRLEAFPLKKFNGEILKIGKLSHKKDKNSLIKVFDIEILLKDSDPLLKPGMTVNCDISTYELKSTYFVDNECIYKDSLNYYIVINRGGKHVKCKVIIGPSNTKSTVISGDFKAGWKVVPRNEMQTKL